MSFPLPVVPRSSTPATSLANLAWKQPFSVGLFYLIIVLQTKLCPASLFSLYCLSVFLKKSFFLLASTNKKLREMFERNDYIYKPGQGNQLTFQTFL